MKRQSGKRKINSLFSLLLLSCSLSLASCPNPFDSSPDRFTVDNLPPDMGSFSLALSGASRTLMPSAPSLSDFKCLELIFTPSGGGGKIIETFYYDGVSVPPVPLMPGTYSLIVNAYKGPGTTNLAARGTAEGIEIKVGQSTSKEVTLKALLAEGTGTFTWNVTVPASPASVNGDIKIAPLAPAGSPFEKTPYSPSGSRNLNSGVYNVTFDLMSQDKSLQWSELVYIYSALVTYFPMNFTEAYFNNTRHTVTLKFDNGTEAGTQSVLHGEKIVKPVDPTKNEYIFDGWYTDNGFTVAYNFNAPVHSDLTLYAKWNKYDLQAEVNKYPSAADDMIIAVPYNLTLTANITVPANAAGKTLTITSVPGGSHAITRGVADVNGDGLFIVGNGAKLTFENIVIDGNKTVYTANAASLVCVNSGGTFTMETGAVLQNNHAGNAGGVLVGTGGTFIMKSGTIRGNSTGGLGGGVYSPGTFIMEGGTISGNTSVDVGAGVNIETGGKFTMSGGEISKNITEGVGGGVYVDGTFTLSGGNINENIADNGGGGIFVFSGTFTMTSGNISGNTAADEGGGVYVDGTFTLSGGEISKNSASSGGGVWVDGGTFTMDGGNISRNIAINEDGDEGVGGGVFVGRTFNMNGGEVSFNTGGGVFVAVNGTFNMNGGTVLQNNRAGNGGGVMVINANFTMKGGEVSNNEANEGGGVYVQYSTFTMSGTASVSGNTANGDGGGVYVIGDTFTMSGGAVIRGNELTSSNGRGGGVFVTYNGEFTMSDSASVSGNTAYEGGGVYISDGTFAVGGTAKIKENKNPSNSNNNVYLSSGKYITLDDGASAPAPGMEIWVQTATADGVIVQSGASAAIAGYFHADDESKKIVLSGDQLVLTDATGKISITFDMSDLAPEVATVTIYRTNNTASRPGEATLTVDKAGDYSTIQWYYGNTLLNDSGTSTNQASLTLSASDSRYNVTGEQLLTVEVVKDDVPYSRTIKFKVEP